MISYIFRASSTITAAPQCLATPSPFGIGGVYPVVSVMVYICRLVRMLQSRCGDPAQPERISRALFNVAMSLSLLMN